MLRATLFQSADALKDQFQLYRSQIISHLEILRVSPEAIKKILTTIDKIPVDQIKVVGAGALAFLTELTNKESQCEDHYRYSEHLAEYFCTLTNVGFFAVAAYYGDYAALLAGTFSAVSHAIPLKRLNELDKFAAMLASLKILYNYDVVLNSPTVLMAGITTLTFGGIDLGIRYGKLKPLEDYRGALHCAWHLAAACTLYKFNQAHLQQVNMNNNPIALKLKESLVKPLINSTLPAKLAPFVTSFADGVDNVAKSLFTLKKM